jgi:hypothetical protein
MRNETTPTTPARVRPVPCDGATRGAGRGEGGVKFWAPLPTIQSRRLGSLIALF